MKNPKKIILTNILMLMAVFALAVPAWAATTANFLPAEINTKAGETFNLTISVDPKGVANFAEKIEIAFPADLLEVKSFTLGDGWMPMVQAGYDSVDNASGLVVKTAGYPGGISSPTFFGILTFSAKKAGNGYVVVGNNSQSFEANTQTSIVGESARVVVSSVAVPTNVPTVRANVPTPEPVKAEIINDVTEALRPEVKDVGTQNQSAAVAETVTDNGSQAWLWIVSIIVILAILGLGTRAYMKERV